MTGERTLPGLGLTGFYDLGADDWKAGVDENWLKLSAVGAGTVKSRTVALPTGPITGDIYIVPSGDTPANNLAVWDGPSGSEDWTYYEPAAGWAFFVQDEAKNYQWTGSAWEEFAGAGGGSSGDPVAVADPNGWTTLAVQEASSDATIDFTFDASLYDSIEVEIIAAHPSSDTVQLTVQVSDDSGVSWEALNYEWSTLQGVASSGTPAYSGGSSAAVPDATQLRLTSNIGNLSDEGVSGKLCLFAPGDTASHKHITFVGAVLNQNPTSITQFSGGSWVGGVTAINGLRFKFHSGNIASGKFVLRGRKKVTSVPDLNLLAQSPDWEIIDVQEASASASIDMTFDPNLFDQLLLSIQGLRAATDATSANLRFSTDGGSTFVATSSYSSAGRRQGTSSGADQGSASSTVIDLDGAGVSGTGTGEASSHEVLISNFGDSNAYTVAQYFGGWASATTANAHSVTGTGVYKATTDVNALRVLMSSGNITAGKFILRGRRKITAAPITGGESRILAREIVTSSTAAVDFTFDPDLYEKIILEAHQAIPVTDSVRLALRVSDDDGATYEATGYQWSNLYQGDTSNPSAFGGDTSTAAGVTTLIIMTGGVGNAADEAGAFVEATLSAPGGDARHKHIRGKGVNMNGSGVENLSDFAGTWGGGTGKINGLRILFSSGNIASGRFILRGILKVQ